MQISKEKSSRLTDPYVTAGNRLYVIGTQDGLFPDVGGHIEGEMFGVWNHPIKLLDGYFIGLHDEDGLHFQSATRFTTYPFYTEHTYQQGALDIVRRQFVPDEEDLLFVTLEIHNHSLAARQAKLYFVVKSDLRPGWLGTETDGRDVATQYQGQLVFTDDANPWAVAAASDDSTTFVQLDAAGCPYETQGNGAFGSLGFAIECGADERVQIQICIAGSTESGDHAWKLATDGLARHASLFKRKRERYQALDSTSNVIVPNAAITDAIRWVKFNTDWLVRTVPSVGNGLGAGLPEYPWWFGCDNGYALQGVLAAGGLELAKDTLRLLVFASEKENGNGRIIHELSATGVVYNPGNTQETPQFCMMVWTTFAWTGDMNFLREMYPAVKKAIEWTLSMAPDGDDLAVGYGIMEVENLNAKLIDTAVYTQQAFEAFANMSEVLGYMDVAEHMHRRAANLREVILHRFWLQDEGMYADVIVDSPSLMNVRLLQWAERQAAGGNDRAANAYRGLMTSGLDGEQPYLLKNWVVSTPVEVGIAPRDHAEKLLERMRTPEFCGESGLYLSGIDRTHMMTISTSVQAVSEARYGYMDEAVRWMERIAGTRDLRMPGSISEMSPDYGCFVQAWTIYGMMVPVVGHMFGVQPLAHESRCTLDVQMPTEWETAKLENLRVGDNRISLFYERTQVGETMTIESELDFEFHFPRAVNVVQEDGVTGPVTSKLAVHGGTRISLRLA